MGKLIEKYNISEKDIYTICFAENQKLGFLTKETIKNNILKPYKVKFLEVATLKKEISSTKSDKNEDLIKKYGQIDLSAFQKKSSNKKGSTMGGLIVFGVALVFFLWVFGVFGGGGLDHAEIKKITGKTWKFTNSDYIMGCSMQGNITLKLTKTDEGYNYELTDKVWDGCSYKYTKDGSYSGKMKDEYTTWSGYKSWDPDYECTYWEFETGGAAGNYGINVNDDGSLISPVAGTDLELRYLGSNGEPNKVISSN